jgi:hypothetical protein
MVGLKVAALVLLMVECSVVE